MADLVLQAVQTKWIGPTNTRAAKIVVSTNARRRVIPWDHGLGQEDNHRAAAEDLARSLGWLDGYRLVGGTVPCLPNGYVWVQVKNS
jgi:hypothetical protein